ncbi:MULTISPECIES: FAD-binding and (Fe-S)-binding domain-containing protein [Candidatus Nitrosocaldus]|jgi:FAD/FMN-containing dehydrogenase/Fe-S oxidoreductase|uniref:D-lactate dehydrogenase (cytochrome) n=1 Tax=Candidatus Nitrosocaldus cavascurensis TaxID=2058097 RepID=A0A2K5ARM9_9ARCH|nr:MULTISPECIES: FAD-binding and (Fe-S)-binding domain-containing protein [Candidatus Nitrosocaldus]SPC34254.1 putative Glycerol-3-phosphate dehydrogenase, anaerobic, C subunit [Candidatus Nitrosocaldus cavascurensis]
MHEQLVDELRASIKGRVLTGMLDRYMYASDASAYEMLPLCIVIARDVQDVVSTVKVAYKHGIPVTARGGGSGLAGQAIGSGIIIDLTHMNRLLALNLEDGYVTVEAGMYKGVLDRELKRHGKFIPVDPSSSDYCTIGGMIANNASGAHTVKYGSMIDYVEELDVVLADGSIIHARKVDLNYDDDSVEARLARELYSILAPKMGVIREGFPKVSKNSSGYRIDRVLLNEHTVDLAKLFVGSEGTLGIVVRASLRIIDIPRFRALALLAFDDTYNAALYVRDIMARLRAATVELLDRTVIDIARSIDSNFGYGYKDYECILFVELDGNSIDDVRSMMDKLISISSNAKGLKHITCSYDEDEISRLWEVRKRALAYTMKVRAGKSKPIAFIEDPVVQVDKLPDLVDALRRIYRMYGVQYTLYGHAGDGNLHTRPILDLSSDDGLRVMKALAYEVFNVVKKMKGSISAEHGDGLARSEFVRMLYGDEIYSLFVKIKQILDPKNIMNPEKKVTNHRDLLVKNLRYSKGVSRDDDNNTMLVWGSKSSAIARRITGYEDELAYVDEVGLCHGCGMCRELNYKVRMCPVYKGLQDEVASCRGRNNVLRWLLNIAHTVEKQEQDALMGSKEYEELIYKYCIQCKMCLIDCPSNVNVGKIMAEARARYAKINGLPKGYAYFAEIDRYAKLACRYSWLSNMLINSRLFRIALEHLAGIDARKRIPRFSSKMFDDLFHEYRQPALDKSVAFFADTYIRYIDPMLGLKIVRILNINGYRVEFPEQLSSGLPAILEGAVDKARRIVEFNTSSLYPYASKGIPIVTFSPSASLALRMEYLNVLDDHRSRAVAEHVQDVHELLYNLKSRAELVEFKPVDEDILVHMHCHTIVQGYDRHLISLLKSIPSLRFSILEKGCCGVGGSYSFIKDNYALSMQIGRELFDAVKASEKRVYTTGESCRLQIEEGSGRDVGLTIDLIAKAYNI